jgi:nanoRNase/pAp phosphatase (c-di-AMP/oligoRNAs hydrolase)
LSETAGKDIVDLLVESFGGEGGGHPSAAAAQVESSLSDVYRTLEKHLEALFYSATQKKPLQVE